MLFIRFIESIIFSFINEDTTYAKRFTFVKFCKKRKHIFSSMKKREKKFLVITFLCWVHVESCFPTMTWGTRHVHRNSTSPYNADTDKVGVKSVAYERGSVPQFLTFEILSSSLFSFHSSSRYLLQFSIVL